MVISAAVVARGEAIRGRIGFQRRNSGARGVKILEVDLEVCPGLCIVGAMRVRAFDELLPSGGSSHAFPTSP